MAARVSELMVDPVNGGVLKQIEYEVRALAATITSSIKHTDQRLTASHAINTAIKEIGDFENWMKTMEFV
ncbi:hypothetical protein Tsubulata_019752 [Turnera subulata]|uniref:Biogenesis of lysosome-related organelles complex 1 subunit 1 n=1 Tax=Turnera subulata TaxID=218843 RepID=A0A9Q0JDR9_9ROSI|nr:hypothetical protein Tsubulata_019752 [Turnera subulata]